RTLLNPHNFCGRAVFQRASDYRLFVSRPVVEEILEVLHRPELRAKFRQLAGLELARIIDVLGQAEAVDVSAVPSVSRDPDDDIFIATALAAKADYLVSADRDLLILGEHKGIKIITCTEPLPILKESQGRNHASLGRE